MEALSGGASRQAALSAADKAWAKEHGFNPKTGTPMVADLSGSVGVSEAKLEEKWAQAQQ